MVSIELLNVFKLLVADSILLNLLFCVSLVELNDDDSAPILELKSLVVVATEELNKPIDELRPDVVVAIDELKVPIDELRPDVVVATDELKEPIDKVIPLVVVATDELNASILVDTLELNVENPVVPVIKT